MKITIYNQLQSETSTKQEVIQYIKDNVGQGSGLDVSSVGNLNPINIYTENSIDIPIAQNINYITTPTISYNGDPTYPIISLTPIVTKDNINQELTSVTWVFSTDTNFNNIVSRVTRGPGELDIVPNDPVALGLTTNTSPLVNGVTYYVKATQRYIDFISLESNIISFTPSNLGVIIPSPIVKTNNVPTGISSKWGLVEVLFNGYTTTASTVLEMLIYTRSGKLARTHNIRNILGLTSTRLSMSELNISTDYVICSRLVEGSVFSNWSYLDIRTLDKSERGYWTKHSEIATTVLNDSSGLVSLSDGSLLTVGGYDLTQQIVTTGYTYNIYTELSNTNPIMFPIPIYSPILLKSSNGSIYAIGGNTSISVINTNIYVNPPLTQPVSDPTSVAFSQVNPNGVFNRYTSSDLSATMVGNDILYNTSQSNNTQTYFNYYSTISNTITTGPILDEGIYGGSLTTLNDGTVLLSGGNRISGSSFVTTCRRLNNGVWEPLGTITSLPNIYYFIHTVTLPDGRVLLTGPIIGRGGSWYTLYTPETNTWSDSRLIDGSISGTTNIYVQGLVVNDLGNVSCNLGSTIGLLTYN